MENKASGRTVSLYNLFPDKYNGLKNKLVPISKSMHQLFNLLTCPSFLFKMIDQYVKQKIKKYINIGRQLTCRLFYSLIVGIYMIS